MGVIGVRSMTVRSALNSMSPPNASFKKSSGFFGLLFLAGSTSGTHLPMILASMPEGPRKKKNQAPVPPVQMQQKPSISMPTPAPIHRPLLLFLPPLPLDAFSLAAGRSSLSPAPAPS